MFKNYFLPQKIDNNLFYFRIHGYELDEYIIKNKLEFQNWMYIVFYDIFDSN